MNFITGFFLVLAIFSSPDRSSGIYHTEHFRFHYTPLDEESIAEIADSMESNYARIIESLRAEELPIVEVYFYASIAELQQAVEETEPNLPEFAIGLAISVSEIHMLSPNHPNQEYHAMIKNMIHEFAHCASLKINHRIANHPRWLWEAVAIYEAQQVGDPKRLSYLVDQEPPALDELNRFTNTLIYDVGYFIAEYIVATKGKMALHELIKNNGNLQATFSMTEAEFKEEWFAYVKRNYGI